MLWTPLTVLLMSSLSLMDQSMLEDSDCALILVLKVGFVRLQVTFREATYTTDYNCTNTAYIVDHLFLESCVSALQFKLWGKYE